MVRDKKRRMIRYSINLVIIAFVALSIIPMEVLAARSATVSQIPSSITYCGTTTLSYVISDQLGDANIAGYIFVNVSSDVGTRALSPLPYAFTISTGAGAAETYTLQWNYTPTLAYGLHTVYYNNTADFTLNRTGTFMVYPNLTVSSTLQAQGTTEVMVFLNYSVVGNGYNTGTLNVTPKIQYFGGVISLFTKQITIPTVNGSTTTIGWKAYYTENGLYEVMFDDTSTCNLDSIPTPSAFFVEAMPAENELPIALIELTQSEYEVNDTAYLYGHGFDADGNVVNYTWLVDANYYYTQNLTATFSEARHYTVFLYVTDDDGAVAYTTEEITVTEDYIEPNEPPTAILETETTWCFVGDTINFYGSGIDYDGEIVEYVWRIDDKRYRSQDLEMTFETNKTYVIVLTVIDDQGGMGITTTSIIVSDKIEQQAVALSPQTYYIIPTIMSIFGLIFIGFAQHYKSKGGIAIAIIFLGLTAYDFLTHALTNMLFVGWGM